HLVLPSFPPRRSSDLFDGVDRRLDHVEHLLAEPAKDLVVANRDELARVPASVKMYRAALALIGGDPVGAIARAREAIDAAAGNRSEEHTSELQSRENL